MKQVSLCMIGFGNVGQAFARLITRKKDELEQRYGLNLIVTGIATARHGKAIDAGGIRLSVALRTMQRGASLDLLSQQPAPQDMLEFIAACPADVLLENSPVNHHTGEPAAAHIRAALRQGMHAVTANKGPVAHHYQELSSLAASVGRRFLFESAVMDGAPIFSLFRGPLPAAELIGFRGILNSCTNLLLEMMEQGKTFEEAIEYGRSIGITETDPSADVDGWDAAIKVAALSTVLLGIPLKPQEVQREGIRGLTQKQIAAARKAGQRWKLVCTARRRGSQLIEASVKPQQVGPDSPLFAVNGTSSFVQFQMDTLPGLGILESDPGPETTAYGLLADIINALRGQ